MSRLSTFKTKVCAESADTITMKFSKVIKIGDEVLTPRRGRQTVAAIEYSASGHGSEPQNLTEIHVSDAFNDRTTFVFESGHYCYGNQVVSIGIATEIIPELKA